MKYAFFPGCSLESTAREYGDSVKAVSKVLEIDLMEVPDWNCCGAVDAVYSYKPLYSLALAARNLALAERMQADVATPCSACYFTLSRTNKILREDAAAKGKVDEALKADGLSYNGTVKIKHFAEVLFSDVGLQKIKEKVKTPLASFKVASYYGCFLTRPTDICTFDNPENPTRLEELSEALGASRVNYYGKTRCCGQALGITDQELVLKMSKDILLSAKNAGANCMTLACPLCHFNLDVRQKDVESRFNVKIDLPILHLTQLIGLAFGLEPKQLGLDRNCVSPSQLLRLVST